MEQNPPFLCALQPRRWGNTDGQALDGKVITFPLNQTLFGSIDINELRHSVKYIVKAPEKNCNLTQIFFRRQCQYMDFCRVLNAGGLKPILQICFH